MGTRILVVDDQAPFRAAVREMLEHSGFDVVGEAEDGESALVAADALHPDLVLLDVRLPGISGVEVSRALATGERAPVVVLTSTDDYRYAVATAGAAGFIPKARLSADLLRSTLPGAS